MADLAVERFGHGQGWSNERTVMDGDREDHDSAAGGLYRGQGRPRTGTGLAGAVGMSDREQRRPGTRTEEAVMDEDNWGREWPGGGDDLYPGRERPSARTSEGGDGQWGQLARAVVIEDNEVASRGEMRAGRL